RVAPRRPRPTLCPYTTLFRSGVDDLAASDVDDERIVGQLREEFGIDEVMCALVERGDEHDHLGVGKQLREFVDAMDPAPVVLPRDRKSTRLNSSHVSISYAVF